MYNKRISLLLKIYVSHIVQHVLVLITPFSVGVFIELGWGDVDWIGLVQDRNRWRALVNPVLNLRVP
jgi:hypothetical protein